MALPVLAGVLCLLASVVVANDGAVQPDAGVCDTRLVDLQRAHDSLQQQLAALQARYDELAASKPTPRPARGVDPASADSKDLRDNIDEMILSERDRLKRANHDEADSAENGPKEISIFCQKAPMMRIADLSEAERDNNECMVLSIQSPEVQSRLVLYCDGTTGGKWTDP